HDALSPLGVEASTHTDLSHLRMSPKGGLDLLGPDLLASSVDAVIEAADDVEPTLTVELSGVSGSQPPVVGERSAGSLYTEPAAEHECRAVELDAPVRLDADLDAGERPAIVDDPAEAFGQAVGLDDRGARRPSALRLLVGEASPADEDRSVSLEIDSSVQQAREHRRHERREHRAALGGEGLGLEA